MSSYLETLYGASRWGSQADNNLQDLREYSEEHNSFIENAFSKFKNGSGAGHCIISVGGEHYRVDFSEMREFRGTSRSSTFRKLVRRVDAQSVAIAQQSQVSAAAGDKADVNYLHRCSFVEPTSGGKQCTSFALNTGANSLCDVHSCPQCLRAKSASSAFCQGAACSHGRRRMRLPSAASPASSVGATSSDAGSDISVFGGVETLHVPENANAFQLFATRLASGAGPPPFETVRSTAKRVLDALRTQVAQCKQVIQDSVSVADIEVLCSGAQQFFVKEPNVLALQGPMYVVGDLHGQFFDLVHYFERLGEPSSVALGAGTRLPWLFLGDYVDRGEQGLEIFLTLLCYKILDPKSVYLLRGNHETAEQCGRTSVASLLEELNAKWPSEGKTIWSILCETFEYLSLAAVIDVSSSAAATTTSTASSKPRKRFFCCHGGPSSAGEGDVRRVLDIPKPCRITGRDSLSLYMLWNDPADPGCDDQWARNHSRGTGETFGAKAIDAWLKRNGFSMIIRAHQLVAHGYHFHFGRRVLTLFSAPLYQSCAYDNTAAILEVCATLDLHFHSFLGVHNKERFLRYYGYHDECEISVAGACQQIHANATVLPSSS